MSKGEELGDLIQKVIHDHTLRGKFSSIHPELRREGIIRVKVGKEGLHFLRESGAHPELPSKSKVKHYQASHRVDIIDH